MPSLPKDPAQILSRYEVDLSRLDHSHRFLGLSTIEPLTTPRAGNVEDLEGFLNVLVNSTTQQGFLLVVRPNILFVFCRANDINRLVAPAAVAGYTGVGVQLFWREGGSAYEGLPWRSPIPQFSGTLTAIPMCG